MSVAPPDRPGPAVTGVDVVAGLWAFYLSGVVVFLGLYFGAEVLRSRTYQLAGHVPLETALSRYDANHYRRICETGYSYDPARQSDVAFFPAYPLAARGLERLTGCGPFWALLAVSNAALAVAFIGLHAYARQRFSADEGVSTNVLLAFGLIPTGFFFRMAYSESLFLCVEVAILLGVRRRWPLPLVAALCGLATATRPVGVAAVPVFLWYAWSTSPNTRAYLLRVALLTPLSCWGLLAYMAFQQWEFADALAFAKTQTHWRAHPDAPAGEKAVALLTLEPLRGLFTPSSVRYWERGDSNDSPVFSLTLANPVYFGLTAVLVALGGVRRWLSAPELLFAAGLLFVPYVTRAYDNSMYSFGRFAAVVVPVYLVLGRLLARGPRRGWSSGVAAVAGFLLGTYAAMFAAGYLMC